MVRMILFTHFWKNIFIVAAEKDDLYLASSSEMKIQNVLKNMHAFNIIENFLKV